MKGFGTQINSKRQNFRNELKKQGTNANYEERQMYFKKIREQFIEKGSGQYCQLTQDELIIKLNQKKMIQDTLKEVIRRILSPDYFNIMMKFYDLGLVSKLVNLLQQEQYLAQTLSCINFLLQKKQINFDRIFYMHGILEYFVKFINRPAISYNCAQGILHYTNKNIDYCQAFLDSKNYQLLINQFINQGGLSQSNEQDIEGDKHKFFEVILYVLQNLIKTIDSTLNFNNQKIEIFNFVVGLIQKRVYLKITIGIAYEVFHNLDSKLVQAIIPLLNQLMKEARPEDKYLYNLFVIIFYLSPHSNINYHQYFKLGVLSQKMQKPFSRTLKKLAQNQKSRQIVPTDEIWWQKLVTNVVNEQYNKLILQTISLLQIQREWVWRLYSVNLQSINNTTITDILQILSKTIKKTRLKLCDINTYIEKYNILIKVQNLAEHNNIFISQLASQLSTDLLALRLQQNQ